MYAFANVLPLLISKMYSPLQLTNMDLEGFYRMKDCEEQVRISYSNKPMHLWNSPDLAYWLESRKYPKTLIDDFEEKRINGYIIQNATTEDLRDYLKITRPRLREKLIEDISGYLQDQDAKSDNWQFACLSTTPKLNQVGKRNM